MKKSNKKTLVLSIVAFVLILMSLVSFTYSWIDDIKLVEFQNDNLAQNGAPLKTGTDINATINITKEDNTINLGNMLDQDTDLTIDNYQYSDGHTGKRAIYPKNDQEASEQQSEIDEKKGYFYGSGDMHLSPCYSDGETFYFPRQGQTGYREGNKDDENVNYISFTAKVSSPDANVDFWFKNEPAIYISGTNTKISKARYAIIVDGKSHIYSDDGNANTIKNNNILAINSITRRASDYTYGHTNNTTEDRGKNSNTLFSIKKGNTVNITIKIWLENGFDTNITASDINVQLVSSWAYNRTIKIVDKTTTNTKKSWLNDDSAKLYLTCPTVLNEYAKSAYNVDNPTLALWSKVKDEEGYEHAPFFYLNDYHSTEDGYDIYTVSIPMVFNNEEMIIYRCSTGWNKGDHSGVNGDYGVKYWNWWESTIPSTYVTGTYTLYGGSHDEYAGYVVTDDSKKGTYLGYGTWGATEEISVEQNYNGTDWAQYNSTSDNVYIRDYSDYDTSGETYVHSMFWDSTANLWKATVPHSSTLLQFLYTQDSVIKGCYGYRSYNNDNPQMRPEGSVKYHFVFKNDKDNNVNGIGYWNGANHVYLIKNGDLRDETDVYTMLFYKYNKDYQEHTVANADFPGEIMTLVSGVSYQGYSVYVSKDLDKTGSGNNVNVYPDRRKSNANAGDRIAVDTTAVFSKGSNAEQSPDKIVYPGCYYDYDNEVWLGSLTGTARSGNISIDETGGSSDGGGSTEGYTIDSGFVFKIGNKTYTAYQDVSGNSFKVSLELSSGYNWTTVQKDSKDYGLEEASQHYDVPSSSVNLYLVKGRTNNFAFNASSAGNYIVTFGYENGNTGTIKITSVLKES